MSSIINPFLGGVSSQLFIAHVNNSSLRFFIDDIRLQCPTLYVSKIPNNYINSLNMTTIEFIKRTLNSEGGYVSCDININQRKEKIFIIGYNDNTNMFYVPNYIKNKTNKIAQINYDSLLQTMINPYIEYIQWAYFVETIFNKEIILNNINDFLLSKNSMYRKQEYYFKSIKSTIIEKEKYVFGLNCYDYLIDKILSNELSIEKFSIVLNTLKEHVLLFIDRVIYLININKISDALSLVHLIQSTYMKLELLNFKLHNKHKFNMILNKNVVKDLNDIKNEIKSHMIIFKQFLE